jgi:hypothetical protein
MKMAERGGRRRQTWGAPVSWREASVLDAARAVSAARGGAQSRADWLLGLAERILHEGAEDPTLPAGTRARAVRALEELVAERMEVASNPPRPGRPPQLY